jgi:S-adenosylmethionine:tRNA ribosyltransferase-isomerase
MTSLDDYYYDLPPELIAQHPKNPREDANLMVLLSDTDKIVHDHVKNFVSYLREGDVVVLNNTKVFKARLKATIKKSDNKTRQVEIFLVKPLRENLFGQHTTTLDDTIPMKNPYSTSESKSNKILNQVQDDSVSISFNKTKTFWQAMGKPGKHIHVGTTIHIADDFSGTIQEKFEDGTFVIAFPYEKDLVIAKANTYGSVPTPPYINEQATEAHYQTVYAKHIGSVAAPTAGFHITDNILTQMRAKRVQITEITLHVGLGTFLPIKSSTIEKHIMHNEWVDISKETADTINTAKQEKRRIIAIGTTTVRALEGAYHAQQKFQYTKSNNQKEEQTFFQLQPFTGDVNLFITPGFEFHIVDCLLTNFHLPKSTLLLLVSAFAGKERIQNAYHEAVKNNYRFFSFGDAMFLQK